MAWLAPRRRDASRSALRGAPGLTLPEMLVVLAVILLLAAILLPSLHRARATARGACCRSNLRQLWGVLHAPGFSGPGSLPRPESWVQAAIDQRAGGILGCPEEEGRSARALLADVWIEQRHGSEVFRYPVPDLLAGRCHDTDPVEFFQVYLVWLDANTLEVRIGGSSENFDGGVRIVLGAESVTFICLDAPNAAACDSNHAVFFGNREVLRLEGMSFPDQHRKARPWVLTASATAYGMNAAVGPHVGRPGQLLLLDCRQEIADPRPEATPPVTELLAPRHLGRVNAVLLDGAVSAYDPSDLDAQSPCWWP